MWVVGKCAGEVCRWWKCVGSGSMWVVEGVSVLRCILASQSLNCCHVYNKSACIDVRQPSLCKYVC